MQLSDNCWLLDSLLAAKSLQCNNFCSVIIKIISPYAALREEAFTVLFTGAYKFFFIEPLNVRTLTCKQMFIPIFSKENLIGIFG